MLGSWIAKTVDGEDADNGIAQDSSWCCPIFVFFGLSQSTS
jgi:hypothetical protein